MSLTELLFRSWWLASLPVGIATSLITAILEFAARVSGNTPSTPAHSFRSRLG